MERGGAATEPDAVDPSGRPRTLRGTAADLRDHIVAGNQLLLCAIVLLVFVLGLATDSLDDPAMFAAATLVIALGVVLALAVPWKRLAPHWVAVVPLIDIVAIGILRYAEPAGGLALLWAFPAMWLASLGVGGLIAACTVIPALYWVIVAAEASTQWTYATVLLPAVVIAISGASYASARRYAAQRDLLDRQAERLSAARIRALRQEQLMTEVLDTVDFAVARTSAQGDVVFENDALGRFQSTLPGFLGQDAEAPVFEEDGTTRIPADRHPLERLRRGEAFDDLVVWFAPVDAPRVALQLTARHLVDLGGQPAGSVLVARDVTGERHALRARDELVASVSHELRTPLTSILGYLELALDEESLEGGPRRYVETAYRNSERLLAIVAGILSASTPSRASMDATMHPRRIDVVEVLRASIADLAPLAADGAIGLRVVSASPVPAYADPTRLRQVVDNLVGNAIKFNRDGGTVTLAARTDGLRTRIEVRDTGVGLHPEDRDRVFDRFFRAAGDVPGNGLGLSISRDIVRAHGGEIGVESTWGEGSAFTVVLPASPEAAEDAARVEREEPGR